MSRERQTPDWQLLERLELRLATGVHEWADNELAYCRSIAPGLGLEDGYVESLLTTQHGRSLFVKEARRRVGDGSRQLMAAMVHAMDANDADAAEAVRHEFQAILRGPVEFYRRIAEGELRKLNRVWPDGR